MSDRPCRNFESPPCRDCQLECDDRVGILESRLAEKERKEATCHSGHTSPVALWDCPVCTERIRAERDKIQDELNKHRRLEHEWGIRFDVHVWVEADAVARAEKAEAERDAHAKDAQEWRDESTRLKNRVRELEAEEAG